MPNRHPLLLPELAAEGHFVRFYDDEAYLLDEVGDFVATALRGGGRGVVIATAEHRAALAARLAELADEAGAERLVTLDARATLAQFIVEGWPDEQRFRAVVGTVIEAACAAGGQVHAFGEMVALLCADGKYDAALRLEELWNGLAESCEFSLFCAYPAGLFADTASEQAFRQVCAAHRHVRAGEALTGLTDAAAVHQLLATWQQKVRSLEAEVERRRRAEVRLEEVSRAKDEFLAMLGHELRNPLSPIVTALQLMRMRGNTGTAREQSIIQRQVDHLVRLVDDLLDVSKVTRGKLELKQENFDVADMLSKAIEMASLLLEQRSHRLMVDARPGLRWHGDPIRLAQVVANLLTNAARYTPVGGEISLRAGPGRDETLEIAVRDNGIGLSAELRPRVFDLFFQGHRGIDRAEGGLGIGLALVKNLVDLHGGTVSAHSDGPGRGSEFAIRLPRLPDTAVERPVIAVAPRTATAALRVLIVDDNADAADALAHLLQLRGHHVQTVYDPVGALLIVEAFGPEVAILDIGLPAMDGYELGQRLRELLAARPCRLIALTGYGQVTDRERSRAAGFEQHLVKPVDPDALLAAVGGIQAPEVSP